MVGGKQLEVLAKCVQLLADLDEGSEGGGRREELEVGRGRGDLEGNEEEYFHYVRKL